MRFYFLLIMLLAVNGFAATKEVATFSTQTFYPSNYLLGSTTTGAGSPLKLFSGSSIVQSVGNTITVDAVNGNDSSGARGGRPFLTLTSAKTAAASGDTIIVKPGSYEEHNLLKNGVNWHFENGAYVWWTNEVGTPAYGIFDDRAVAGGTTNVISGRGKFLFNLSSFNGYSAGMLYITNTLSDVSFQCGDIIITNGFSAGSQAAIHVDDCRRVVIDFETIIDPLFQTVDYAGFCSGIYWRRGPCYIRGKWIQVPGNCVWGDDNTGGTDTANLYLNCDYLHSDGLAAVYLTGASPNYRLWVTCLEATTEGNTTINSLGVGGKLYVNAEKISSASSSAAGVVFLGGNTGAFGIGGTSQVWVTSQKITTSGAASWLTASGTFKGNLRMNALQYEDTGTTTKGFDTQVGNGGTFYIQGGRAKILNGKAVNHAGGSLFLSDMILDSSNTDSTNNAPIFCATNNLTVKDVMLLAPASAYAINATNAQTIVATLLSASNNLSANVTLAGTTLLPNYPDIPFHHVSTNNGSTDVYYPLGMAIVQTLGAGVPSTNGNLRLIPFYSGAGGVIDSLSLNITTLSNPSTNRLLIYKNLDQNINPTNLFPGALLSWVAFDTSTTGTKISNLVSTVRLQPHKVYWAGAQSTSGTVLKVAGSAFGAQVVLGMSTNYTMWVSMEVITTYDTAPPDPCPLTNYIQQVAQTYYPVIGARFSGP